VNWQGDLEEAERLVLRRRVAWRCAVEEAEARRARARAHAGGMADPRAQGLWDAAAFHAARAVDLRARLEEAEAMARALARSEAEAPPGSRRPAKVQARRAACG
jgi:hypothetical protein